MTKALQKATKGEGREQAPLAALGRVWIGVEIEGNAYWFALARVGTGAEFDRIEQKIAENRKTDGPTIEKLLGLVAPLAADLRGFPDFAARTDEETDDAFRERFERYFLAGNLAAGEAVLAQVWAEYNVRLIPRTIPDSFRPPI
jgi:hypothetical protein